jgi:D-alanyl-D-alanine carboxypeptidase
MIKFLSNQEIYPTEVFSSPIDGNYYYTPRAGDISGLNDSRRFHRTYFYRYQPPGVGDANYLQKVKEVYGFQEVAFQDIGDEKNGVGAASYSADITDAFKLAPDFGQAILNWKQDLTTLSMFTNYIISNNSPNNKTSQNTTNNVLVNMSARPAFLSGLPIAGRNKYIVDETISTITEATSVGINFARMHSKELRGSSMTINGDPSMTPGEILQVIGNPMYSHLTELPEILRERKAAYDYILKDNKNYQVLLENMKGQEENKDFSVPNPVLGSNSDLTNNIMQDPNMADANVTGRLVKNTKSALDVLAAPMDADYSTIIKEGAGDKVAVTYDSKPGETPVQQASAAIPSAAQNSTNTALSEGIIPESAKTFYTPTQTRYRITSPFGPRFLFRRRGFHSGIDLGTPMGVPILASRSGLVTYSDWMGAYGKTVVLKHSDGMSTLYGHMSVLSVSVGAQVTVGQEVGKAGSTGRSTGPHLHFEIRSSTGIRLNPVTYLSSTLASQVKSGAVPAAPTPAVTTASNTNTTPTPASTSSNLTPNQQNSVYEKYKKVAEAEGYKETYSDVNAQSAQQTTSAAFNKMKQAAASSGVTLNIVSSYRSIKDQTAIFEGKINSGSTPEQAAKFSAPPGYSQHHTGYAVDINSLQQSFDQTAAFGWLNNNAVKYGFVMSYPKNISTDLGANYEPWHFIYVGDETAMGVFKDYIKRAKDGGFDILRGDSILNALYEKALKANSSPVPGSPAAAGTPTTPPTPDYTSPEIKNPLPDELWRKSHFSQEPVSMYRVDAVKHEFNVAGKSGYTTEVVLFSLFGG